MQMDPRMIRPKYGIMRARGLIAVGAYAVAILAANVLTRWFGFVPAGFGLMVTAGTYAAGFALLARDFVQQYAGMKWVFAGIASGIALSWVLASPALAIASAAAFGIAELSDLIAYLCVRRLGFITAAAISNLVSAPIDTMIFLAVAGFPLTWVTFDGQLVGKLLWATLAPLIAFWMVRRAVFRQSVNTASS